MDNTKELIHNNLSDKEKQDIFLIAYRKAPGKDKTINKVCEDLALPRHEFDSWLSDPEFEDKFWALRRAHSYELEEQLSTISAELLTDDKAISKGRYFALQIAQKSVLEIIGKLNRERFGESTEVRLKQEGSFQPAINISLVSADIPSINIETVTTIEQKKEAIEASVNKTELHDKSG